MTLVEKAREAARAYHAEVHMEDPTGENCGVAVLQAILSDPSIVEIEVGAELPYRKLPQETKDFHRGYLVGQRDMLKANWVKKKDGGRK